MPKVIRLSELLERWDKNPTLSIKEHKKREHARKVWFFQRRKLALDNIARSIAGGADSTDPNKEPPNAA